MRKLTEKQKKDIKELYDGTFGSVKQLAEVYNVSVSAVRYTVNHNKERTKAKKRREKNKKTNYQKEYYQKNKERIRKKQNEYRRKRKETEVKPQIVENMERYTADQEKQRKEKQRKREWAKNYYWENRDRLRKKQNERRREKRAQEKPKKATKKVEPVILISKPYLPKYCKACGSKLKVIETKVVAYSPETGEPMDVEHILTCSKIAGNPIKRFFNNGIKEHTDVKRLQ